MSKGKSSPINQLLSFAGSQNLLFKATREPLSPRASQKRKSLQMTELRKRIMKQSPLLSERYDIILEKFHGDETALLSAISHLLPSGYIMPSSPVPEEQKKQSESKTNNQSNVEIQEPSFNRQNLRKDFPNTVDLYLELTGGSSTNNISTIISKDHNDVKALTSAMDQSESKQSTTADCSTARRDLIARGVDPNYVDLVLENKSNGAVNNSSFSISVTTHSVHSVSAAENARDITETKQSSTETNDEYVDDSQLLLPELNDGTFSQPVLTSTGEEQELVIFNQRSKMFIFCKEDQYGDEVRRNMWKERGKGQLKLLKHTLTGKYRILMRQEATKKVICNAPIIGQETFTYPTPKQIVRF
jgi:hypothetical protein